MNVVVVVVFVFVVVLDDGNNDYYDYLPCFFSVLLTSRVLMAVSRVSS